jgi:group I intron endonuclease
MVLNRIVNGTVYIIQNKLDGKAYVGQTTIPFKSRLSNHVQKNKSLVGRAINKHGIENFDISLSDVPYIFLDNLEVNLIKLYGGLFPNGYNLDIGGSNHKKLEDSTREKISAAAKLQWSDPVARAKQSARFKGKNSPFYGKPRSKDIGRKISAGLIGKALSEDHKAKLSAAKIGKHWRMTPHGREWYA